MSTLVTKENKIPRTVSTKNSMQVINVIITLQKFLTFNENLNK